MNGFCFSVTKGAFLDMQLGRTAKEIYSCETDPALAATSLLKFKPRMQWYSTKKYLLMYNLVIL